MISHVDNHGSHSFDMYTHVIQQHYSCELSPVEIEQIISIFSQEGVIKLGRKLDRAISTREQQNKLRDKTLN